MARKTNEQIRADLDLLNEQMQKRQHISDAQLISHTFVGTKLKGRERPDHSKKLKGRFTGNDNPAKRPEVREKIRNAALKQHDERSARTAGDNNPAKRPEVREKIKQGRALQVMVPKYSYVIQSPKGKLFKGTSIRQLVEITGIPFEAIKHFMMSGKAPAKGPNLGWKFTRIKNKP